MSAATMNLELQQSVVKQHCKVLRMPTVSAQFSTMAEQAVKSRQTHVGYLEALLSAELEEREKNTVERRIREARLPKTKTLDEFDFSQAPKISAAQMRDLADGGYIERAEPIQEHRFIALRYEKKKRASQADSQPEQYPLFDTPEYSYRVFVTNMTGGIALLTWFYNQRASAENLIKEAKNDAGMADHPSGRWAMNCIFFQLALLAYNLNCWLMLFQRDPEATVETLGHTTLATARLKLLFLAARIWSHARRVGVSYSDHYADQPLFNRLMARLRSVAGQANEFAPVIPNPLRC